MDEVLQRELGVLHAVHTENVRIIERELKRPLTDRETFFMGYCHGLFGPTRTGERFRKAVSKLMAKEEKR